MAEKTAVSFELRRLEILDANGEVDEALMPDLPDEELVRFHEFLILARQYDQRALSLQREGRIGTSGGGPGRQRLCLARLRLGLPFFVKVSQHALLDFPHLNATVDEEAGEIVVRSACHIGVAVDTVAIRKIICLSLTFDHRVVDGAYATRFLNRVAGFPSDPGLLFIQSV